MTNATIPTPDFLTSDWHIGHHNILKYDRRPFRDVDEMLHVLIDRHNSVVEPEKSVVFLGDIFFSMGKMDAMRTMDCLLGRKTLILGNHDRHSKSWYRNIGFETVLDSATITDFICGGITLIHNPLHAVGARQSNYVIHGHKHSTEPMSEVGTVRRVDVSVTCWDYYPAPATKVIDLLRAF